MVLNKRYRLVPFILYLQIKPRVGLLYEKHS